MGNYPSYFKEFDPTIEFCLTCQKKVCNGNCVDLRNYGQGEKIFIVRAARTLADGQVKYGYIRSVTKKDFVQSVSKPDKLPGRTYSSAYYLMMRAEKLVKENTVLEVIRKDDVECEKK